VNRAREKAMMDADFEGKIRSRIEAILINDARNYAEIRTMASEEEPLEVDPFAEERNLYQRIINNYRNAVGEVNNLLEENVSFISGLCRIVEDIKEKNDFQEICSQIVNCVLQDMCAEFCGLVFRPRDEWSGNPLFIEGVREQQKLLFSHSHPTLLGSLEFAQVVERLMDEAEGCINFGDVYREPSFNKVDFPSVVRSLVCIPIRVHQKPLGALVLSHSLPRFFTQNHARVLKILASMVAHLWLMTEPRGTRMDVRPEAQPPLAYDDTDILSIVLLSFEREGSLRRSAVDRELIRSLWHPLTWKLEGKESLLPHDQSGLLILVPGIPEERLSERVAGLRIAFEDWKARQGDKARGIQLSLGYASCGNGEELSRTLEAAAEMLRAGRDDLDLTPAEPGS
jgi:hypothetical protein